MKKYEIVKNQRDFDYIIHNGKYIKNKFVVIYNKDNNLNFSRFGIAVGKKIGNAVTRNKIKRQLRMIITNNKKLFKNSYDYIIIVKTSVLDVSYKELEDSIIDLINGR